MSAHSPEAVEQRARTLLAAKRLEAASLFGDCPEKVAVAAMVDFAALTPAQTTLAPVPAKELIADIVGHLGAAVLLMPDTVEDAASLHIRQAHTLVKQLRRASL